MENNKTENLYTPDCIRTYSGKYVNVLNPNPDDILIEDIAHALSNIPRFGGHLYYSYSVAQHCISCFEDGFDFDIQTQFDLLMHDSAEAYIGDMVNPIKKVMPEFQKIEHMFLKVISDKFRFRYPFSPIIKNIDSCNLEKEWELLMLRRQDSRRIQVVIKERFLHLFFQLSKRLGIVSNLHKYNNIGGWLF